jgi:hypothetical protein
MKKTPERSTGNVAGEILRQRRRRGNADRAQSPYVVRET